jgi:hypothetical protein
VRGGYAFSILIYPLSEDSFMKNYHFLALAPFLLVITPVAADMYCGMNNRRSPGEGRH